MNSQMTRTISLWFGIVAITSIGSQNAQSAGLEKSVMWSGRYAGVAGAVSSSVEGPESLFFNPAGLANAPGIQVSGNFSPTFDQFSAPFSSTSGSITSNRSFSPPGSIFVSYEAMPKLSIGVGYYVSGGTKAIYENISFSPTFPTLMPTFQSNLAITELSTGAGYELCEGLKVGLAYRVVFVRGQLSTASASVLPGATLPSLIASTFDSVNATRWNGFRLGVQYSPKDSNWGLGAQWRTEVGFNANSTLNARLQTAGSSTITDLSGTPATLGAVFPQQISIGGFYDLSPKTWRLLGEYAFTNYNVNQTLNISGSINGIPVNSIPLNWNNMSNFRVGTEYKLVSDIVIRGGYVLTTQVTPNGRASPIYSSPGLGHSFFIGGGMNLLQSLQANLAFEYSRASGTVSSTDSLTAVAGDYSSNVIVVHLGATYHL